MLSFPGAERLPPLRTSFLQIGCCLKVDRVSVLLKVFVVGSGVLLIVGAITLAVMIGLRMTASEGEAVVAGPGPAVAEIALPAGARVEQVVPDRERLLLLGTGSDGRQFVAIVDPADGALRRLFHLTPDAAP